MSYLRWQYGIYSSMGMSYYEFWECDYRLVESFIKRKDMETEKETDSNWETVTYIRAAILEVATAFAGGKKNGDKAFEFPSKPQPRTVNGALNQERNKLIETEINNHFKQLMASRKAKSDSE